MLKLILNHARKLILTPVLLALFLAPTVHAEPSSDKDQLQIEVRALREAIEDHNQLKSAGYNDTAQAISNTARELKIDEAVREFITHIKTVPQALQQIQKNADRSAQNAESIAANARLANKNRDGIHAVEKVNESLLTNQNAIKGDMKEAKESRFAILITSISSLITILVTGIGALIMKILDFKKKGET